HGSLSGDAGQLYPAVQLQPPGHRRAAEGSAAGRGQRIGEMTMSKASHCIAQCAVLAAALLAAAPALAQSVDERLDALEARITRLEDMNQIERVQRTYGYFVDKSQWTQLAELFTDD